MEPVAWISGLVGLLALLFVIWFVLIETSIRVEPGTIALLLTRGKATSRALTPGRHFMEPWRKVMVQIYPSTELALIAGGRPAADLRVEYVDDPLRVYFADRAQADLSYTVRCQLDTANLQDVHNRFGPEGLWSALRDTTRRCLLAEAANGDLTIDDAFGDGFTTLERRFATALEEALGAAGFQLRMFSLRVIDLGDTGEVIQATVRAGVELEREQALAEVRRARLENDAAMRDVLDGGDVDVMLRYRQIEAWRDILHRWDGDQPIPSALTVPLNAVPAATVSEAVEHLDEAVAEPTATDTPS